LIIKKEDHAALYAESVKDDDEEALEHYGILRKSGRYPWGSGETPHERASSFQNEIKNLRDEGLSEKQIASGFGMNVSQLRTTVSIAKEAQKQAQISQARHLREDKGYSNVAIGRKMNIPESTVRNLLRPGAEDKANILKATSDMLRAQVEQKKYVDVGKGVELHLGISHEKLRDARKILQDEGYTLHYLTVEQLGTGKNTTLKVLAAPGTTFQEVLKNRDAIQPAGLKSTDGGRSYDRVLPPVSIDSKRVKVRYAEEGGTDADGVIYVRPGVKDLSLGKSRYAQVRVAVDGTHYLKGMAMYKDDLPDGVDLMFNTNKSNTGNKLDALKKMKDDPDDPFGANIDDQIYKKNADGTFVRDAKGTKVVESVMNIVNKEGNWDEWSKNLSSQMLSKQNPTLAKKQLELTYESKKRELDELTSLTNPTVQKHLLEKYAESTDSSAVHLKAAHLPRQATKVILPVNSMKENEVYAPTFRPGESVVLIRFPHGGKFEIPELKVNNKQPEARKLLGNAPDAIGIHSKVAERLSGADFDGDTVLVIPNNHGKIKTHPALKELQGFDPQSAYPGYEGMPKMSAKTKGMEMGKISNLITDMTIKGAPFEEIARAVKHSMVVIDAEKHNLNYKQSAIDNGIASLKKKYQVSSTSPQGGAATLISRASSEVRVSDRKLRSTKEGGPIDKATGKPVYVETGAEYYTGKPKTVKSTKLAETDDAHTLSSGMPIEHIYAEHSNRLKDLANEARKQALGISGLEYSPSANKAYSAEVSMLGSKLNLALRNAPLERQAQVIANARYRLKKDANPDMDAAEIKKLKSKELDDARKRVGAKKDLVEITQKEWEAIQAGAITKTMLEKILDNTDVDKVKQLATPRDKPSMSTGDLARAMQMLRDDQYSLADVADQLGITVGVLRDGLAGEKS
jgi:hypothetical protein